MRRKGKIQRKLEEALKELEPSSVTMESLTEDGETVRVRVISEKFRGVQLMLRFRICATLMEKNARDLTKLYSFIFEPVTRREYETKILGIDNNFFE